MSRTKILIADDEAHVRTVVRMKLAAAGFEVIAAIDGQDAYELACECDPELLITDLQMPRMTGLELCLKIRANPALASLPAIMLTSRGDVLSEEQKSSAGIVHLLDKPFSPRQILSLVEALLASTSTVSS